MSESVCTKHISIALATYNGADFLKEQLDSIYAQTLQDFDLFVCDDCSTDTTVEILEDYRLRYGLQYQVNEVNIGFLRNFEQALTCCQGEFIVLADQDDVWLPDKLESLIAGIGTADLVYSDASLIDEAGNKLADSLMQVSGVKPVTGFEFNYFVCNTCITGCTLMIRRHLLEVALPIPDCEQYHDWWLAVIASCHGGIRYVPRQLVKYRQHGANDTGASVKKNVLTRMWGHLTGATESQKQRYYLLLRNRAQQYTDQLQNRLALTFERLSFLRAVGMYADALLNRQKSIRPFLIAARYHKVLFPTSGPIERLFFVASKLITPFLPRKFTK